MQKQNAVAKAKSLLPNGCQLLMLTYHGSVLYGTNTPESDLDIKGIYLPPLKEVILNSYPKHLSYKTKVDESEKNTNEDWDITLYSLQEFLRFCYEGETIAIDMLHSDNPSHCLIESSDEWRYIVHHRSRFYTKEMKAFLGYVKKQAAKYGFKGTRMASLEAIKDLVLPEKEQGTYNTKLDTGEVIKVPSSRLIKLYEIKDKLPISEFSYFKTNEKTGMEFYRVLDSDYQLTISLTEFKELINTKWERYGERSRLAKENQGVDWKAISHAYRAGCQLEQIYKYGSIQYPLSNSDVLLEMKKGLYDYSICDNMINDVIERVTLLSFCSGFPTKVDRSFWEAFILDLYLGDEK